MENKAKIDYLDSFCRNCQAYKDTKGNCPLIDKRLVEGEGCYDVLIASDAFDIGYVSALKNKEDGRN